MNILKLSKINCVESNAFDFYVGVFISCPSQDKTYTTIVSLGHDDSDVTQPDSGHISATTKLA